MGLDEGGGRCPRQPGRWRALGGRPGLWQPDALTSRGDDRRSRCHVCLIGPGLQDGWGVEEPVAWSARGGADSVESSGRHRAVEDRRRGRAGHPDAGGSGAGLQRR
jgi:hypothetical protein